MSSNNSSFTTSDGSGDASFGDSNSLVSKFAFILLVLFAFMILLRVGIKAINYLVKPTESPHLFDGSVDATQQQIFYQDPSSNTTTTIYRSVNQDKGIEFTWSVWINITNLAYLGNKYRTVFFKGNDAVGPDGLNSPNNAPGVYLVPNTNALLIMMNTYEVINHEIIIPDIPINIWFNVIIRCENTKFDVYINGNLARSIKLKGVPKQNYGNVYVATHGGFEGNLSNLWYWNYALGTKKIQDIVRQGPNLTPVDSSVTVNNNYWDYLSLRWYFNDNGHTYINPQQHNNRIHNY